MAIRPHIVWRALVASIGLILLFFAIAAPTGGGGGGASQSSSSSYSSSDTNRYTNNYYYYFSNRNYGGYGTTILIAIGALVVIVVGLAASKRKETVIEGPYRLGSWLFLLERGEHYSQVFGEISRTHSFDTPESRRLFALRIARAIDAADVSQMVYFVNEPEAATMGGIHAEKLMERLIQAGGINLGVDPSQSPTASAEANSACLLGIVEASLRIQDPASNSNPSQVLAALMASHRSSPGDSSYLSIFYEPGLNHRLSMTEAKTRFESMSACLEPVAGTA